uniref:GAS2-like protein 1 n=1 Tax=Aceria tosichella TaxID=561515 RepID=A0A6G1SJ18_9ACAR
MSTSTYYNFVCSPADQDKRPLARTVQDIGQLDQRRQTAISPDSFVTSSSDSSSSLNSQFNSYTPNSIRSISTTCSTASTFSNSFNLSSSSPRVTTTTSVIHPADSAFVALTPPTQLPTRSSSIKSPPTPPPSSHMPSQMIHSYTLNSLEPRPLKPFKSRSAYIDAMKEDLAEWLNSIYSDLELTPDNLFSQLETGAIICRHANNVTQMGRNLMIEQSTTSSDGGSGSDNENNSLNRDSSLTSHHRQNSNLNSPSPDNGDGCENGNGKQQITNNNLSRNISHFIHRHRNSTTDSSTSSISTTTSSSTSRQRLSLTGPITASMCSPRSMTDRGIDWFRVKVISYKSDARPGTFFARDNICQFILWCRSLRILECLLFETDDLVSRKNEKSFILCLLEVARIGFKVGMPTPLIIQLEQEIDREIEKDAKLQKQLGDSHARDTQNETEQHVDRDLAGFLADNDHYEASNDNENNSNDSLAMQKQLTTELNNNHDENKREDTQAEASKQSDGVAQESEEETEAEEEEFSEDFGPKPQLVLNDLMNLHERVVQLLCQCTCPTQFPMVRIGDGKYKVGDKLIIFVRILRRHIMVRVGGGWQELSEFLRQKDPCRMKQQQHGFFNHQQHSISRTSTQTNCCIPVSRSRLVGSSHQLYKSSYHSNRGPGGSSICINNRHLEGELHDKSAGHPAS